MLELAVGAEHDHLEVDAEAALGERGHGLDAVAEARALVPGAVALVVVPPGLHLPVGLDPRSTEPSRWGQTL
jgi:hypothetical protein